MGPFAWFFGHMSRYKNWFFLVALLALIEPILYMVPLFLSADIVQILFDGGGWPSVKGKLYFLIPVAFLQALVFFMTKFLNEVLAHRITTDITYDLYATLQNRSLAFHDQIDIGEIMARATNDTRAINIGLSPGFTDLISTLSVWSVTAYVLLSVHWALVLSLIIIFSLFVTSSVRYGVSLVPLSTRVLEVFSELSNVTQSSLSGIREIKAFVAEATVRKKFESLAEVHAIVKEQEGKSGAWFYPSIVVLAYTSIVVGGSLVFAALGMIQIGTVVLLLGSLRLVSALSEDQDWIAFALVMAMAATNRVYRFLSKAELVMIPNGFVEFTGETASIEFRDVVFRYRSDLHSALDHVSFMVNDNETIAIVGGPGSGKSTIAKLIQRLYLPESGVIILSGQPIDKYSNESLRARIATVEQDVFLFNDSILENIRFGKPRASLEEVIEVAKLAQAHEFIISFPDGYDTLVGENGVKLSGGQAQRIAIARALLIDPAILIMDDGASALDAKTELEIQKAISTILKTRTTVITTHRLAIIAQSDKIIILEKGKIVGIGSHEELIRQNMYYRRLFSSHYDLPPLQKT